MRTTLLSFFLLSMATALQAQAQEFVYKTVQGHSIKANIFLPSTQQPSPVLVYFHGGGFIFGNKDQGLDDALKNRFLANQYAVVSADYRLAPETKLDEILKDVSDVVTWLKQNGAQRFGIDTGKIVVAGGSSGGYLALSTGFTAQSRPKAIVAISTPTGFSAPTSPMGTLSVLDQPGPYDVVTDSLVSHGDYSSRMDLWRFLARNRLGLWAVFGFDPYAEPAKLAPYRLTSHIDESYPPILLIHAQNDRLIDIDEAEQFYRFLQKNHVTSELYVVENGHSSELINQYPDAIDKMVEFLNRELKK